MAEEYILEDTNISIVDDSERGQSNYSGVSERPQDQLGLEQQNLNESILEWFDRSVEQELHKHRQMSNVSGRRLSVSQGIAHPSMLDASASGIEILGNLRSGMDSELSDAADKFAKAEAMVMFEGAVRAAEYAAARAPPELAEEAAVAGAKGYQAELTGMVNEHLEGVRPVEVIGYVGITKPTKALLSKPKK